MQKGVSPEERLLRLIRKGTKKSPGPEEGRKAATPEAGARERSPKALEAKTTLRRRLPSLFARGKGIRKETIKVTNRVLLWLLLVLLAYLSFDYLRPRPSEVEIELPGPEEVVEEEPEWGPPIEVKPYEFYTKEIGKRELFMPLIPKEEAKPEEVITLRDLAADLNLIGVVESDGRLQAIVEDKKQRKTYFLYRGDSIGEIRIKDVLEGKVILGYEDEELELVL